MSDDNQTFVPASFVALYQAPGTQKLQLPQAELAERYELCEDLAQMLTDTASAMLHSLHITEADVLQRCLAGLQGEGAVVRPDEAGWVVRRLAELMGWPALPAPPRVPGFWAQSCGQPWER